MFRGIEHINLNTKEPQKVRIKIELKLNLKVKEIRLEKKENKNCYTWAELTSAGPPPFLLSRLHVWALSLTLGTHGSVPHPLSWARAVTLSSGPGHQSLKTRPPTHLTAPLGPCVSRSSRRPGHHGLLLPRESSVRAQQNAAALAWFPPRPPRPTNRLAYPREHISRVGALGHARASLAIVNHLAAV